MNNDTFEKKLEDSSINKTIFSELTSLPYQTVMNWKRNEPSLAGLDSVSE
jgi:hypothetical protein